MGRNEVSYLQLISDTLSVITILTCFILKIPQILRILKMRSAIGVSLIGLLMELSRPEVKFHWFQHWSLTLFLYTIMMSYNFRNGYALLSYMEYPIILIQELILILCVMHYKKCFNIYGLFGSMCYFTFTIGLLSVVPKGVLTFLVPLCTPVGASSKVVQLIEIIRTKNSESISLLTWFISAFTNFTRIFTIVLDSADAALLLNFSINVFLSSSVLVAAYIFKPSKVKKEN